jgi:hypothetical protein
VVAETTGSFGGSEDGLGSCTRSAVPAGPEERELILRAVLAGPPTSGQSSASTGTQLLARISDLLGAAAGRVTG